MMYAKQTKAGILACSLALLLAAAAAAQVPGMMSYQGRVMAGSDPFDGTGWFKFALVNATGDGTYWSNDGSSVGGGQPIDPIEVAVSSGLFTLMLGDTSIPNMTEELSPVLLAGLQDVRLRIWFSENGVDFVPLAPDQPLASAPYALVAGQVPMGAIGENQLAHGAITASKIASGAVSADKIAEATITSNKLDWSTMPAIPSLRGYAEDGPFETPPVASGTNSIAMGNQNVASATAATVSGGEDNIASGNYTSIAGGGENRATNVYAAVGGGNRNQALGVYSFIGGGIGNHATRNFAVVAGGDSNRATNDSSAIVGGIGNWARGHTSFVGGGRWNHAHAWLSAIAGGDGNRTHGDYAAVVGGRQNTAHAEGSFVGGGFTNTASGDFSVVGGGQMNVADGAWTFVGGGYGNSIEFGRYGVIAGGLDNMIAFGVTNIAIGGGFANRGGGTSATIAGGQSNVANGEQAAVGGGLNNAANGYRAVVGGGQDNSASGSWASVPGGRDNQAGDFAFAAGRRAKALQPGSFVWADSTDADVLAQVSDSVTFRAAGGYRLFSDAAMSLGAELEANATSWSALSDREAKENFEEIDTAEILEKLRGLPLTAWNYKDDPEKRRYIGPVAQDFHAAFGLGTETTINTLDADGVALAAIQGLLAEVREQRSEVSRVQEENAELRARLDRLETLISGRP